MPTTKFKEFISKVKGYGFVALTAAGISIALFMMGYMLGSGIALGVFITRNWDIIKQYYREYIQTNINF